MKSIGFVVAWAFMASQAFAGDCPWTKASLLDAAKVEETISKFNEYNPDFLDQIEGKGFLYFSAIWNPYSKADLPYMSKGMPKDFTPIYVFAGRQRTDFDEVEARAYLEDLGAEEWGFYLDRKQKLSNKMRVFGTPVTFFFDKDSGAVAFQNGDFKSQKDRFPNFSDYIDAVFCK